MADRILGMGDVVTLVEKVQEEIDEKEARREADKMMNGKFTLNDLVVQMKRIQKMGTILDKNYESEFYIPIDCNNKNKPEF